jgi:hypothetical protein
VRLPSDLSLVSLGEDRDWLEALAGLYRRACDPEREPQYAKRPYDLKANGTYQPPKENGQ